MKHSASFLLAAATLAAASSAHAADGTWTLLTAGNASGTWSTGADWSGSTIADGTDGTADFSTLNITATSTIALDTARSIGTLKFGDATTAGNNWNLNSAGAGAITLTLATSAGTPTINVINQTATIGTQTAATNVILAGTQGFTKTGTGRLVLADGNTNTYGGTTFISQGTLQIGAGGAFGRVGSASTIIDISSGATLNHVQGATVNQVIQGAGNVLVGAAGFNGSSTFTGLNTYTGSTTIDFNTLSVNTLANSLTNSAIGASDGTVATNLVITNGGTLAYTGTTVASTDRLFQIGSTAAGGTGTISNNAATANTLAFTNTAAVTYGTNNQTRTVGLGGSNTGANTFAALIGNNGTGVVSLTKSGAGNWSLTSTNTFTGATSIQQGTLTVASIGASGASGNLGAGTTINFGATTTAGVLKYTGTGESTNRAIVLAGQSGGATFDQSGTSGNLAYTGTVTNTGTGSKTVTFQGSTGGTGSFSGNIIDNATTGSTGLGATFASGATTVTLASVTGITAGSTISGTGIAPGTTVLSVAGNVVTLSTATTAGSGSVGAAYNVSGVTNITSVNKSGTGTWTLSGANTYTGTTTLSGGTLVAGTNNAFGSGALTFGAANLTLAATTGSTITLNNSVNLFSGVSNFGDGTNTGSLTLTNIVAFGGVQKQVSVAANTTVTMSGVISAASGAGLTKLGAGTLILSNTGNTFGSGAAGLTINGGTLSVAANGSLGNGAIGITLGGGNLQYTGATATIVRGLALTTATSSSIEVTTGATTLTMSGAIASTTGALTKLGAGTLALTGNNSHTGGTTVSAGKLLVNGNSSGATGAVTVAALATLGGTGTVGGAITVDGTLQGGAGAATGTLTTVGTVTLAANSVVQLALGAPGTSSTIAVGAGGMTFDANQKFTFLDLGAGVGAYTLLTGLTADPTANNLTITNAGWEGNFSYSGNNLVLNLTAVPEPSTYGLIGAGALAAVAMVRRRRKVAGEAA